SPSTPSTATTSIRCCSAPTSRCTSRRKTTPGASSTRPTVTSTARTGSRSPPSCVGPSTRRSPGFGTHPKPSPAPAAVSRADAGRIGAVEALVRWQHPEHGLLGPDQFIPQAEATGLVRELTLYVLDRALAQLRCWRDEGIDIRVAVNLSARDLYDLTLPETA